MGRLENIASYRKLIEHCSLRLDLLYFLDYQLDEPLPWHSTVSRTRQQLPTALFEEVFTFSTEGEEPLLELAGSLSESLNAFHAGLSDADVERELADKCVGVTRWPEGYVPYTVDTEGMAMDARDGALTAAAQLRAREYLQRHEGSEDPVVRSRMVFVEYLLLVFTYNYRTRYVHTHELLQHLNSYKYENYTEHRFRSLVVGPVRDVGVLIVSSSAGYKRPCSTRDIYNFFNYYNQQIQPMLHRLGQCHRDLELATGGGLYVMEQTEYANLKKLLAKLA